MLTFLLLYTIVTVWGKKPNIIFLMVDQMDGRNMDRGASDQYNAIQMPNLRNLAQKGTQFVRHYTNGPQCVPGRSVLWLGRRTNDIHVYNNAFGISSSWNGTLDNYCIQNYNEKTCQRISTIQSVNYTILNAMQSLGYNVYITGKLHIGAAIMQMPSQSNATNPAFSPPGNWNSMISITRSANILRSVFPDIMSEYNDTTVNPHSSDADITEKCIQRLNTLGS
eukprot:409918_1